MNQLAAPAGSPPGERRIGFVGLGRMGSLIATNLMQGGYHVTAWNRTAETAKRWASDRGASVAPTLAELAERSDVVITMLADGDALLEVCSPGNLLDGVDGSTIVIDMGTSGPQAFDQARTLLAARGAVAVDAPVSGSVAAAEAATLLVMVGAPPELFDEVAPILSVVGKPIRVGETGSAAVLKLAVNSILYGLNTALAEAVLLAEDAGVEPTVALDVITQGAAGAPMISYRREQYLEPETAPVTFTLDLSAKDIRLALETGEMAGLHMEQLARTLEITEQVIADGHGDCDMGYLLEALRRRDQAR